MKRESVYSEVSSPEMTLKQIIKAECLTRKGTTDRGSTCLVTDSPKMITPPLEAEKDTVPDQLNIDSEMRAHKIADKLVNVSRRRRQMRRQILKEIEKDIPHNSSVHDKIDEAKVPPVRRSNATTLYRRDPTLKSRRARQNSVLQYKMDPTHLVLLNVAKKLEQPENDKSLG